VIGLQAVVRRFTGQDSSRSIVAATLLIAVLFAPLRRRLQATIDRRFCRHKYDAGKVLAAHGVLLRTETELDQLSAHLVAVVHATMQPAHVSLWKRPPRAQRAAGPPHGALTPRPGNSYHAAPQTPDR
jgi:hypothetical protein